MKKHQMIMWAWLIHGEKLFKYAMCVYYKRKLKRLK